MARVLYGIHGTGHGHAMRGLTIARRLSRHEFLFVADDDAPKVLEAEFPVRRLPNLGTVFKNYKVDLGATIARAVPLLLHRRRYIDRVLRLMDEFRPDVCMTDLEYFVPRAAEQAGLPCLTLDHQHIITCYRHNLPPGMWWDAFVQGLTPRYLFRPTAENLIISFYAPPVLPRYKARVAPPILRDSVLVADFLDARLRQRFAGRGVDVKSQQRQAVQPGFGREIGVKFALGGQRRQDVLPQQRLHQIKNAQTLAGREGLHGAQLHETFQRGLDCVDFHLFPGHGIIQRARRLFGHMGHGIAERVPFSAQKTCGFKGISRVYRLRPEANHIVFPAAKYFLYVHGFQLNGQAYSFLI